MEGNSVECGQRFVHIIISISMFVKTKIVLIIIEVGDGYRGSL